MSEQSALYFGSVFHRRLGPTPHRFRYRLFWLYLDLDELDALSVRLRLFSHNRFNLFSLNDRDHGDGGRLNLRKQALALLEANAVGNADRSNPAPDDAADARLPLQPA